MDPTAMGSFLYLYLIFFLFFFPFFLGGGVGWFGIGFCLYLLWTRRTCFSWCKGFPFYDKFA